MADSNGSSPQHKYYARRLIDSAERFFSALHRRHRYKPAKLPVKVNLGSGLRVAPGWINIDGSLKTLFAGRRDFVTGLAYRFLSERSLSREQFRDVLSKNTFVHYNLKYGIPLPDSSAEFIFTSHSLHHLYRDEAQALLADALRVLRPGGTIRIAVPNLEYIFSLYERGERERALEYFFYPSAARHWLSSRHYQYDFELLRRMLETAGFRSIRRCSFRQGRTPDLEQLDNLPAETLFVEAEKPADSRIESAVNSERLSSAALQG